MPGILTRLQDGWRRALDHAALALVPALFALVDANKLRSVLAFDGVHVGFKLGAPISVVTLWQFVSVPQTGVNVDTGLPISALPVAVATVPALLVAQAGLAAGYFGSIADALDAGEFRFFENVASYFLPFLLLTVLPFAVLLPFALGVVGAGSAGVPVGIAAVVVVAVPLYLGVVYLFYATPYLVVLRDDGLLEAARGSYGLAVQGGPYLAYFAGFAAFVLLVSPLATVAVVTIPVLGLVVGVLGGSLLGLASNVATMRFLADVDPQSPDFEPWPDAADDDAGFTPHDGHVSSTRGGREE